MSRGNGYTRRDKKTAKHKAKVETGKFADNRKKAKRRGERRGTGETDYSESAVGAAVKDAVHRAAYKTGLTKKRYRTKKVAPGNVGEPKENKTYTRVTKKPEMKNVEVQAAKFQSEKGEVARSKTYTANTEEGLKTATKKATSEINISNAGKSKTDVGKKEFAENKAKQELYKAKREARKKAKEEEKYESGSRTRQTRARQSKNVEEQKRVGTRKSYKRRKKEYIQKAKSSS